MPVWYSKRACARDGNDRRNSASAQCVRVDPLAPPPAARAEKLSCIFDATTSTLSTNMTSSPARHPHHPAHRCFGCTCALNTTHPLTVQCCDKNVLCIRRNSPSHWTLLAHPIRTCRLMPSFSRARCVGSRCAARISSNSTEPIPPLTPLRSTRTCGQDGSMSYECSRGARGSVTAARWRTDGPSRVRAAGGTHWSRCPSACAHIGVRCGRARRDQVGWGFE